MPNARAGNPRFGRSGVSSLKTEHTACAAIAGATTLLLEVALTRVFSLTQGYHFAFLSVSLALLGAAAGGAAVAAGLPAGPSLRRPAPWCLLAGPAILLAAVAVSRLPVETYALAWSARQAGLSFALVLLLTLPFALLGMSLALSFELGSGAGAVYAANLVGSAAGALAAALILPHWGPVRSLVLTACLSAAALLWVSRRHTRLLVLPLLALAVALPWDGALPLRLSTYQPLWQALQAEGSQLLDSFWSRQGRVDVVAGPNLRMAGGISPECPEPVPPQTMVYQDGDSPRPIVNVSRADQAGFVRCLPGWTALRLRGPDSTLVLDPAGDVSLWLALTALPGDLAAVVPASGVRAALSDARWGSVAVRSERVRLLGDNPRALLRGGERWDLVYLPLRGAYRAVGWGTGSLTEDYGRTVEALTDALAALADGGYLVAESWLQQPPSEELRLWLTVIEALARRGVLDPAGHLLAARSMQTLVIAASPTPWSDTEIARFRAETQALKLDLVWVSGIQPQETNHYNRLPEDVYHQTFAAALADPAGVADGYAFMVQPPTDGRPFPHHYFRWSHTTRILAQAGQVALPFGGIGFLLLPLLLVVLALLAVLLLGPALVRVRDRPGIASVVGFVSLGLGYLLVELPFLQAAILLLRDAPTSMALVVSAMLLGSGLAAALSERHPSRLWLCLPLAAVGLAMGGISFLPGLLTQPDWVLASAVFLLGSLIGFGLGGAFPTLMRQSSRRPGQRAWAVAANGAASTLASVLATGLAVLGGFGPTLGVALTAYALVAVTGIGSRQSPPT